MAKRRQKDGNSEPPTGRADSPALERYRQARAEAAELELAQRRRELLPVEQVQQILGAAAALIRQAGEVLQRRHGPAAADILTKAIDKWLSEMRAEFGRGG